MTLVTLLVALVVGRMAQYTSDQVMVQRLQTTRSLADARPRVHRQRRRRRAVDDRPVVRRLRAVRVFPDARRCRREYATDKLVPYFMSLAFPAGAVGLVIAAIMAASLSSIDSAINSCTSVAVVDLYNRLWRGPRCVRPARQRRRRARSRCGSRASRRCCSARWARRSPATCRASASLLEINAQGGQRVHRSAVRHLSAGDVQPRGRAAAPCWWPAWPAPLASVLRGLPQRHRLHVAVDVRPGGDTRSSDAAGGRRSGRWRRTMRRGAV